MSNYASAQVAITYTDSAEWKAYDDFNSMFLDTKNSKNIYMALKTFHFMIDSNKTRKFTKKLNAKFRKDAAFRNALKETFFVKWSDALEGA